MVRGLFVASFLAALCTAGLATITFTGVAYGQSEPIKYMGNASSPFSGKLNFTSTTDNFGIGLSFKTVCVDLDHQIGAGATYTVNFLLTSDGSLSTGLKYAGRIVDQYFASANTAPKAAALQLAVWEAVYDAGATADFTTGNLRFNGVDAPLITQASTYYSAVTTNPSGVAVYLKPVPASSGQAQMTPVPEPATLSVLAVGALAMIRRRAKSRK